MIVDWMLVQVMLILLLATFIRSAFGFGEALVAVPLLALLMPVEVAAPLAVLVSITVAVIIVAQDWQQIHFRSAAWLILSTLIGTPLGLLLLIAAAEQTVKALLGFIIVGFAAYILLKRQRPPVLENDGFAWMFGFVAGILGGAYGMNGPPLVVYGSLRGWSPQNFRATLQGYFLPASLMVMGGYWLAGLWTVEVTHYYLLSLPVVVAAIVLGRMANQRMNGKSFLLYVHLGLLAVGTLLLFQSIARPFFADSR